MSMINQEFITTNFPQRKVTLVCGCTEPVVKDKPELAERDNIKNIFVEAPCVFCIAYDTTYDISQVDCGLLCENNILSAWSKGICI